MSIVTLLLLRQNSTHARYGWGPIGQYSYIMVPVMNNLANSAATSGQCESISMNGASGER